VRSRDALRSLTVETGGDGTNVPRFADLGEHVASILSAAEQAADQIRADAEREAEQLRTDAAEAARSHHESTRARATDEAERLVSAATADARAIRDTARAAATRIAEEGQRRLQELRTDARALEGRFESAVDELHDLIAQLDDVVQGAVRRPETSPLTVVESPADAEPDELERDLWPGAVEDPPAEPDAEPAAAPASDPDERPHELP
jgi:vacuolar-type H+-ATPase subunit H